MANELSTELFKVILTMNAHVNEKLNSTVVGSSGRNNLGHIPPYLASHVHDRDSYSSIYAEVNAQIAGYLGPFSEAFMGVYRRISKVFRLTLNPSTCVRTRDTCSLFLPHNVLNYSNKPFNVIENLLNN